MKFKRFEVWLADLSPKFGTEPGKTRPVLILQTDLLNKVHPSVVICPITTNVRKNVSILRVNLKAEDAGLKRVSAVMIDQVRAIDNKRLIKKTGDLPLQLRERVMKNMSILLEIK